MKKIFTLIAVAVMAFAVQAEVLSVCRNGGYMSGRIPIYGFGYDTPSLTQQIYPDDMLADMAGKEITEISLLTLSSSGPDFADDFIKMEGGEITLALMEVDQQVFTEVVAMSGATVVATTVPEYGSDKLTFALDEPFTYNGGNLLVEVTVTEYGTWYDDTWFAGSRMYYNCTYFANGNYPAELSRFLCAADFTYQDAEVGPVDPPTPTDQTAAPSSSKENYVYEDANLQYNAYTVTLIETEPSDIYYRVGILVDGDYVYGDWMLYTGEMNFTEEGTYMIEAYAIAPGKLESEHIWDGFTVSKVVDVEELFAGKTVASVRYYNLAGQEMQQANGLTIMVTTFTDGTTSAVKVVK